MKLKLLALRETLQQSIWFIPALLCLLALFLAVSLPWVEREMAWHAADSRFFAMDVNSARDVLGVIAGSVLSVGGVVFSVTMVALTLTSGQYGPKILRHFLGDKGSKVSLGMFLGTSLYCLLVLSRYNESDQPGITVIAALAMTIASLVGFIHFIHRTATDLQADQIIERIGGELQASLRELTASKHQSNRSDDTLAWRRRARRHRPTVIGARARGYVQTVDYVGIVAWCVAHDCVSQLRVRAGDFLLPGNGLVILYGDALELDDAAVAALRGFVRTGPMRNPVQDPEFPITQLNQLAARALSPGINDPGTAITCIDWFSMAVAQIVDRQLPGKVFLDGDGAPRLLARYTDFSGILKAFYAPSRQFASSNVPVLISLADSLFRLAELTTLADRLACIAEQGRLLSETTERGSHMDYDLKDFRQRYRKLVRVTARQPVQ